MSDTTAKRSRSGGGWRGVARSFFANREAVTVALYALFAILAVLAAYFAIFTELQPYDDEGTLLATLQAFVRGHALYRDVYSSYGPFYYELFGGFFKLTGQGITTDASRTIVVIVWTVASLLFGITAQRVSKSLAVGLIGAIAAFAALGVLVNEPMHPQGLCALLVAAVACIAATPRARPWAPLLCGLLLGALLMTKINLGIFAIAAAVLAAFLTVGPLYRVRWLRWLVVAAFLVMPVLILDRDLKLVWVRELLLIAVLASGAIAVAAMPLRPLPEDDDGWGIQWVKWALIGVVVAAVAILAIIVATGPSLSDVYEGIVTQAVKVRDVLVLQFGFPNAAVDWAVAAFAAAVVCTRLRAARPAEAGPSIWGALGRLAAGLVIICSLAHLTPFGINPSAANPVVVPMLLAWVAAIPLPGRPEDGQRRYLRVFLPALAVAGSLGVYPVAGSQTGIAAVTFVPAAALCIGDGLVLLRAWGAARGPLLLERATTISGLGLVALACLFALQSMILPTATNAILYHEQKELPLPGAHLMHLPEASVEEYVDVVNTIKAHHCTALVGYPSFNSFYLWTGLEAPAPQLPNGWMDVLDEKQQQRVVGELEKSPRVCGVRSYERAKLYELTGPPEELALVRYINKHLHAVAEYGDFQFLLPRHGG